MRVLLLLLLLLQLLEAVTLREYSFYEKPQRIDLMLTFDTPYQGKITRTRQNDQVILILKAVQFPQKSIDKTLTSDFVRKISIASTGDDTRIVLYPKEPFAVNASKTIDNMGLRIRIQRASAAAIESGSLHPIPTPVTAPKQTVDFSGAFLKVLLVLGGVIVLLWMLKRWLMKKSSSTWLFGQTATGEDLKILAQKPLDMRNRLVLLGYGKTKYLVILGESNLLLERFEGDEAAAFDALLQKEGKKLGEFLQK